MEELRLKINGREVYDEENNTFYSFPDTNLVLVHSLRSVYHWEAKYKEPFMQKFGDNHMTNEETLDYIKFMIVEPKDYDPAILNILTRQDFQKITDYINDSFTATVFNEKNLKKMTGVPVVNKEIITSEIIYYWMTALNIPFECDKWNFNQLLTLIRVCSIKNSPGKKMSQKEIMSSNKSLNALRRAKLGSKG